MKCIKVGKDEIEGRDSGSICLKISNGTKDSKQLPWAWLTGEMKGEEEEVMKN